MIKVVLLDLNDTLLLYPRGGHGDFVRQYLALLNETLTERSFDANAIINRLIGGVKSLGDKTNPLHFNNDIYWGAVNAPDRDALGAGFARARRPRPPPHCFRDSTTRRSARSWIASASPTQRPNQRRQPQ